MIRAIRHIAIAALPAALLALTGCPKPSSDSSGAPAASSSAATTTAATAAGSGSSAAAPSTAGGTIKFTKSDPQVGSTWSEAETQDTKFDITKPEKFSFEESGKTNKKVEVLATSGKAITKVKVTYSSTSVKTKENDVDKTKTVQVSGNTYIVESSGGGVTVTDQNHKPVGAAETAFIADDFKGLGKPDPFTSQIPDVPLSVGAKVDSLADALRESVASSGDLKSASVTLKDITSDGNGVFDVKVAFSQPQGKLNMTFNIDGTLTVRSSDSRIVSFDMKGPITFAGGADGKGTFSSSDSFTY